MDSASISCSWSWIWIWADWVAHDYSMQVQKVTIWDTVTPYWPNVVPWPSGTWCTCWSAPWTALCWCISVWSNGFCHQHSRSHCSKHGTKTAQQTMQGIGCCAANAKTGNIKFHLLDPLVLNWHGYLSPLVMVTSRKKASSVSWSHKCATACGSCWQALGKGLLPSTPPNLPTLGANQVFTPQCMGWTHGLPPVHHAWLHLAI